MSNHTKGKASTSIYAPHLIQDELGVVICSTTTYNNLSKEEREANARHIASLWNTDLEYDHTHTADVVEALERLLLDRHHHQASTSDIDTCKKCGSNYRNTAVHFICGECESTDKEKARQALKNIKREKV